MTKSVSILAVAGQTSFFGQLENRGLRVLDLLNDSQSKYVRLKDVAVCHGIEGDCVNRLREATISKDALDFVLLEPNRHETPLRRFHAYVDKPHHAAVAVLAGYEISGALLTKGSPDAIHELNSDLFEFFPLASPSVRHIGVSDGKIAAGAALIHRSHVALLDIERQAVAVR